MRCEFFASRLREAEDELRLSYAVLEKMGSRALERAAELLEQKGDVVGVMAHASGSPGSS